MARVTAAMQYLRKQYLLKANGQGEAVRGKLERSSKAPLKSPIPLYLQKLALRARTDGLITVFW